MELKGDTYRERVYDQLENWVEGNSIHNTVDDECCPDFSCCTPTLLQPKEVRENLKALKILGDQEIDAWKKDNRVETPNNDKLEKMLVGFFQSLLDTIAPKEKVHITG